MSNYIFEDRVYAVGATPAGKLTGSVEFPSAAQTPVSWKLRLFFSYDNLDLMSGNLQIARWLNGNGTSATFEFRELDPNVKYHAIAFDLSGKYDPVVKTNLIPTVD